MRLYLIRHADPDYERDSITPAGHLEAQALAKRMRLRDSITPAGHLEAQALAKRMRRERLDRIYVSPLGRAIATAKYTAELLNLRPVTEDWTCEIGDCFYDPAADERLCVWDTPGEIIRAQEPWPTLATWDRIGPRFAPVIREKFEALRRCSDAFLARHGYQRDGGRYRITNSHREHIAIFCHNGTALFWLAHLLEIPLPLVWSGFWHAPSAVTTILFEERSKEWAVPRALTVADTAHLYAAGLPVQPSGIKANFE